MTGYQVFLFVLGSIAILLFLFCAFAFGILLWTECFRKTKESLMFIDKARRKMAYDSNGEKIYYTFVFVSWLLIILGICYGFVAVTTTFKFTNYIIFFLCVFGSPFIFHVFFSEIKFYYEKKLREFDPNMYY